MLIGLAVASKLYPVVLLPLWITVYSKQAGWLKGIQLAVIATGVSFVMLLPMAWDRLPGLTASPAGRVDRTTMVDRGELPTLPNEVQEDESEAAVQGSLQGLSTLLTRWEMNDLLFMIVEENIRPAHHVPHQPSLWFVVVPDAVRQALWGSWQHGQGKLKTEFLFWRPER